MTISASQIAKAIPSVLGVGGSNATLLALLLSQATAVPIGKAQSFPSADAVGQWFGFSSPEYQFASVYFGGITNALALPAQLLIMQYPSAAVSAWLQSGSLAALTLAELQALTGTLSVTVDGTANTSASINLSAATSYSNAATIIQTAFTSPNFTISWNAQRSAFVITSNSTGVSSTIGYASGTLAAGLKLDLADGAINSQGADAATPATFMPTVLAATTNWAAFATAWEPVTADKVAFAQWNGAQNSAYAYVMADSDVNNASASNFSTTATGEIVAAGYGGTIPIYGDFTHAAMVCSWAACLDFVQRDGRTDLAGISAPSVVPYVTDDATAAQLVLNGVNFYGEYSNKGAQFNIFQTGVITGPWAWADSYMNQIALNDDLESDQVALLASGLSIPYNNAGYAIIESAYSDTIQKHLNFGTIRTGVTLSSSQKQALFNKIGADVSQQLQTQGYYLFVAPANAATRQARTSPPITLYYTDGGDVQSLVIDSVAVQ